MDSSPAIARVEVGSFRRDAVTILRDIRWTIRAGEHWAVLGPNGSGKTTLLRILSAYEWPTEGQVEVLGKRFGRYDLRELRKQIGIVSSALEPRIPPREDAVAVVLSGFDASIGLARNFTPDEDRRALAALEALGAGHLAMRRFGVLSQGERQRVLIARALIHRPPLLILDEPAEGLDPLARERLLEDLERFSARRDAPTIALVTHHLEEIPPFVTHALLLAGGSAIAEGRVEDVLTDENLSRAFGVPCEVVRQPGRRWSLRFARRGSERV
jgi:iron complex transport system ATP-binding protein